MTAQDRALADALDALLIPAAERETMTDAQLVTVRKSLAYQSALLREQMLDFGRAVLKALPRRR